MDQTISRLNEFLQSKKSIAVVTGKDPNMDQMAAALSLYLSLSQAGRQVSVATPDNPLVEVSGLVGIDKVKTTLGSETGDLIVSFPYKEGEIDKVSYTLEGGYLNIVVKAGEQGFSFNQKDVKYTRPGGGPGLLFIVGASRLSDLGKLFDPEVLKDTTVVNIDNSPQNQGFGDLVLVSNRLSSVSEEVANILLSLNLPMDADVSQNLLDGILFATSNFQNPNTSGLALEMAGILMRNGARRESLAHEMASTAFNRSDLLNQKTDLKGLYGEKPQTPVQTPNQKPSEQSPQSQNQDQSSSQDFNNPPQDWLTPKVYKGSTNF